MKTLLIGIRDKTALFFTWFIFVWVLIYSCLHEVDLSLTTIWQLLAVSFSMSLLINLIFKTNMMKQLSFTSKLTLFLISCGIVESILIFQWGLYGISSIKQIALFYLLFLFLYIVSLGIFQIYRMKESKKITQLLKNYQQASTNLD